MLQMTAKLFFSFPFLISFHSFISPLMQIHTLQLIIEARSSLVSFAAVIRVVTRQWGGALRDE